MIEVELPDGTIAEFPDDMQPAQIQAVLQRQFGTPEPQQPQGVFAGLPEATASQIESDVAPVPEPSVNPFAQMYGGLDAKDREARVKQAADLERIRQTNPYLADLIENTDPVSAFFIGAGEGMTSLGRGIGIAEPQDEFGRMADEGLRGQSQAAKAGRLVGQTAPFLPAGGIAGNIASTPIRAATMGGIGAAEGGIISKGEGGSPGEVATGAGAGLLLGASGELVVPVVNRYGRRLIRRLGGGNVDRVVTPQGSPTPEFERALQQEGRSFDDVVSEAAERGEVSDRFTSAVDELEEVRREPVDIASQAPEASRYDEIKSQLQSGRISDDLLQNAEPDLQTIAAADELGISLNPDHYSNNKAFVEVVQSLKSRPGSTLSAREQQAITSLGNRADELITDFGGSLDKSVTDSNIRSQIRTTVDQMERASDDAYAAVREAIPANLRINPKGSKQYLQQRISDLGGNESALTSAEKRLLSFTRGQRPPTYTQLDDLRKDIGRGINQQAGPFRQDDPGRLNQIYSALVQDQQRVAQTMGVGDTYRLGSGIVQQRKDLERQYLTLFGRDTTSIIPKLTDAASKATKGDISKLNQMFSAIPENLRQEAAATLLNDVFTMGGRTRGPLNQGFVNAYRALNRNQGAKDAIFRHLPDEARRRFDLIGRVSTGLFSAKSLENTSKTARDVISAMDDGGMFGKIYDAGKKVAAAEGVTSSIGIPGAGTAGVVGTILAKGRTPATVSADRLIASDRFSEALRQYASGNTQRARAIESTEPFRQWIRTVEPSVAARVSSIGLVPWLVQEQENDNQTIQ